MAAFIQVSTTTNTRTNAEKIAKKLLHDRLAACVQLVGPIHSRYWWNSKLKVATEWLCIIKAQKKDYQRIESTIIGIHSYRIPEILAVPILEGNPPYLRWIRSETARKKGTQELKTRR
jgi:periplasmic divalent cation tolerance protein